MIKQNWTIVQWKHTEMERERNMKQKTNWLKNIMRKNKIKQNIFFYAKWKQVNERNESKYYYAILIN